MLYEPATTQPNNEETTGYILEHALVKPVNDISPHRLAMGGMGPFSTIKAFCCVSRIALGHVIKSITSLAL
jgi:hypothetical protein